MLLKYFFVLEVKFYLAACVLCVSDVEIKYLSKIFIDTKISLAPRFSVYK